MTRNIIAIVVAVTVGVLCIALGEVAVNTLYPVGKIPDNPEDLSFYIDRIPKMNRISMAFNWTFAAIIASAIACWIQGRTSLKVVLVTVGVLQLLTYMNLLMLPGHPAWMWLYVTFIYVIIGFIIYRLLRKKHVETNEY